MVNPHRVVLASVLVLGTAGAATAQTNAPATSNNNTRVERTNAAQDQDDWKDWIGLLGLLGLAGLMGRKRDDRVVTTHHPTGSVR